MDFLHRTVIDTGGIYTQRLKAGHHPGAWKIDDVGTGEGSATASGTAADKKRFGRGLSQPPRKKKNVFNKSMGIPGSKNEGSVPCKAIYWGYIPLYT